MIHVMTVHYHSDQWIAIQLRHLRRNLSEPFRLHAFLVGVPQRWRTEFYTVREDDLGQGERSNHAVKLNSLAEEVCRDAADDDLLIFIDGDAFPIRDPLPFIRTKLPVHRLVAVRRSENLGDIQPHPLFCVTTAAVWRGLPGDWRLGPSWKNVRGDLVTDVGARLLPALDRAGIPWLPILRSNTQEFHPLWFGVYGDLVYHHGAGFRSAVSRCDLELAAAGMDPVGRLLRRAFQLRCRLLSMGREKPSELLEPERFLLRKWNPYKAALRKQKDANRRLSALILRLIETDPEFYQVFKAEEAPAHGRFR